MSLVSIEIFSEKLRLHSPTVSCGVARPQKNPTLGRENPSWGVGRGVGGGISTSVDVPHEGKTVYPSSESGVITGIKLRTGMT